MFAFILIMDNLIKMTKINTAKPPNQITLSKPYISRYEQVYKYIKQNVSRS